MSFLYVTFLIVYNGLILLLHLFKFILTKMKKSQSPKSPPEFPLPEKNPEFNPDVIPESPLLPEEEPDIIPEESPFQTPPYEVPSPGEAP